MLTTQHPVRPLQRPDGAKPLFSFVLIADTHVNERDDTSSSPFETNRAANDRARHVFRDVAAMDPQPAFILHLGDIVHPVPSLPTFQDAVSQFKQIAAQAKAPLHVVPGNHDVGDKCIDWMPADQVCDDYLRIYREAFGPDFYAFDHENVRFVAINSLLLNSGLPDEQLQREWVEEQVRECNGGRVYLFMHYPPYIYDEKERGNYDNLDEPARSWLLEVLRHPNVEAVFAGHVHNFWYDRIGTADFYMLPSTAFLRHDFTEFYRVAPANEFGRGDVEKFGYFIVDVYADGHVAYSVKTHGQKASATGVPPPLPVTYLAHPRTSRFEDVGVELRHPWTEATQITSTGGVQEFGRKWARNDYPLLALWEMGARLSKVPEQDVTDPDARRRMAHMARQGHRFIATCLGRPHFQISGDEAAAIGLAGIEVNATLSNFDKHGAAMREWRQASGVPVSLSKIHTFDDSHFDGKHFSHFVKAGFSLEELPANVGRVREGVQSGVLDGVTIRVEPEQDLAAASAILEQFARDTGVQVLASLKTSGPNLATERADEREFVQRVVQAMLLSRRSRAVRYVFDVFMDVDRGYYPRQAFIDRRFDLRPAARAFTLVNTVLGEHDITVDFDAGTHAMQVRCGDKRFELVCCPASQARRQVAEMRASWVYDLFEGTRHAYSDHVQAMAALSTSNESRQVLLIELTH